jgi:L-rhamnose mutarotase
MKDYYKRYCKILTLKNDSELIRQYKEVHGIDNAWPEITNGMKEVGIIEMEIYIHGNILFMIMDTVSDFDHEKAMTELAKKASKKNGKAMFQGFRIQTLMPLPVVNGLLWSVFMKWTKKLSSEQSWGN